MTTLVSRAVDRALDALVAPGFSELGYRVRERSWPEQGPSALVGKRIAVTGASSGIGEAICEGLLRAGAGVDLIVRDRDRGERALERTLGRLGDRARRDASNRVALSTCDVSDLVQVRELGAELRTGPLHGLVHNAGVLTQQRERSTQGHELTLATHVLGPFLLTLLLEPALRAGSPARVVWVASGGMYTARLDSVDLELGLRQFDGPRFYAHAKRIQVILAELLAERWRGSGVEAHSMHPGWVDTPGLERSLPRFHRFAKPLLRDPAQGADTAVWLLSSTEPSRHAGAFWHDRRPRSAHRLPWTRESEAERRRLWASLVRLTDAPQDTPEPKGVS